MPPGWMLQRVLSVGRRTAAHEGVWLPRQTRHAGESSGPAAARRSGSAPCIGSLCVVSCHHHTCHCQLYHTSCVTHDDTVMMPWVARPLASSCTRTTQKCVCVLSSLAKCVCCTCQAAALANSQLHLSRDSRLRCTALNCSTAS